jgi:mannose/fructose/N-acetylgalactosamine-specific phosphotransferase system component IIB
VIVLSRIDSRLVHGQVIEAWLPHLDVRRLVVADDEAAEDALAKAAFGLVVPPEVEVLTTPVTGTDFRSLAGDRVRTLVLFRTVGDVVRARAAGLPDGTLNVGNLHAAPGKTALTRSVYLDRTEAQALATLREGGMNVVIQAVPNEVPTALPA